MFQARPLDPSGIAPGNLGIVRKGEQDGKPSSRLRTARGDQGNVERPVKKMCIDGMLHPAEARLKTLFVAGLDGDSLADRAFLIDLSGHLRGFLRKRIDYRRADIEDIVQEVLLAVHNNRHTYRSNEPLTPWLHAIARYKLMDFHRARARCEALNDPLDDHIDAVANSHEGSTDARHDLGKLLHQLPDCYRLPIVHMKLQGLSVMETVELTGMSESAVKVGVHRGMKVLARKIRDAA